MIALAGHLNQVLQKVHEVRRGGDNQEARSLTLGED
jgi:hypothetical protein